MESESGSRGGDYEKCHVMKRMKGASTEKKRQDEMKDEDEGEGGRGHEGCL